MVCTSVMLDILRQHMKNEEQQPGLFYMCSTDSLLVSAEDDRSNTEFV